MGTVFLPKRLILGPGIILATWAVQYSGRGTGLYQNTRAAIPVFEILRITLLLEDLNIWKSLVLSLRPTEKILHWTGTL